MSRRDYEYTKEERELMEEVNHFIEDINEYPEIACMKPSSNLQQKTFHTIKTLNMQEDISSPSAEERELIKVGVIFQKRRKLKRTLMLAAVMVALLAFGITSLGEAEKIFESIKINTLGREQVHINSHNKVEANADLSEDKVYEDIESTFGFLPIRLNYLPEGIKFVEAELDEELQRIYLLYGDEQDIKISYFIRPNYREGSWGKDVEDELLDEYVMQVNDTNVTIKQYLVKNGVERWLITFEYTDVSYSALIMDSTKSEVEEIVTNLYFF